jgi:hypothetical protein
MNKPAILGAILLCGLGCVMASCSSEKKNNAGAGGQSSTGGSTATGGSQSDAGTTGGSTALPVGCESRAADAGPERADAAVDGGLVQIGNTDPSKSIQLGEGGFFTSPSGEYKGYCFTFTDVTSKGTSTMFPTCGKTPDCFTQATGLCPTALLGIADKDGHTWGAGIGCNLNQKAGSGTVENSVSLVGKTSLSVQLYGCKTPNVVRLQLNIDNPVFDDAGTLGSGYYCSDAPVSAPDSDGIRKATVQLTSLTQDCWKSNLVLDTSTMTAKSVQVQIGADQGRTTDYDFCISNIALE